MQMPACPLAGSGQSDATDAFICITGRYTELQMFPSGAVIALDGFFNMQ